MSVNTTELMKPVGKIKILTQHLIDDRLSGDYHSVFKGQGVEFDEVRPYVPGDDVRSIDWNVTARTGHPHVKRFSEERELTVIFLVDVSGSQVFGSGARSKSELAAEVTCLLAMTAIRNQDKIGLILFSDRILKSIPPRKGRTAVMRLVREVLAADETREGTDITAALRFLNNVQKRKAVVFLVSDFQDTGYERELRVAARHHDMIACPVSDPCEFALPNIGLIELQDPESGELLLVDTSAASVRNAFRDQASTETENLLRFLKRTGIDFIRLSTDTPYIDAVRGLFHRRARKR
ncbi:MAG: DUF58 domain-containing protein [Verrucomicrobiota bacterium]|jgi:uncharacterized protein (DUF58 family)|nr:DUF58 domain-containing protein [Verrucomicrobiota bacterium]